MQLRLSIVPGQLAVCRLPPHALLPAWATAGTLWCVARSEDELSIVCEESRVPDAVESQGGFRALKVEGPLDFALTGVLAGLTQPLAGAGISVFVFSTYETDYLLVRTAMLDRTIESLAGAGFIVSRNA